MTTEILRDRQGNKLGEIRPRGPNELALYDRSGYFLGVYRSNFNATYTPDGTKIGTGNQLTRLLR